VLDGLPIFIALQLKGDNVAICKQCGVDKTGFMSDLCAGCISRPLASGDSEESGQSTVHNITEASSSHTVSNQGSASTCIALGTLSLLVGLYFLVNPTADVSSAYGAVGVPQVANIHKLALGQTLAIVGAVFLAAGLRPRR
jgi:hypothetical protein